MESKTLILHPDDASTDFLKPIYSESKNYKLISGGITKSKLKNEIIQSNNIIMMGHGSKYGLFGKDFRYDYIIDSSFKEFLHLKNCLLIWCNSDDFVSKNKLKFNGIYTGMFISELSELINLSESFEFEENIEAYQPMIDESNNAFSSILGNLLKENSFDDLPLIYEKLRLEYGAIAKKGNEVAAYNNKLLYLSLVK